MAGRRDFYEILGVPRIASQDDIQRAHRDPGDGTAPVPRAWRVSMDPGSLRITGTAPAAAVTTGHRSVSGWFLPVKAIDVERRRSCCTSGSTC
jgi:hypothetical protein